ncbi:hypothetical protein KP509_18G020000 [Ceratopteris richardii]|uniref:Protein kinase domain-containing protein n=1 Tax=Ceratopteris richardii TaxID=49495 RepID=A0A8T2SRN2_CERRI|nr:hypothetical protein KP509_18G020000 [Ceratopteris richardii]
MREVKHSHTIMASVSSSALFLSVILQISLLWSIGSSQKTGFTSIDCGSDYASVYTDEDNIQWLSDGNLMSEGTSIALPDTGNGPVLSTMRLFNGSQSKYCYSLSNSAVKAEAFFLVRASIFPGTNLPYTPKNPDGYFRFKMIIDADQWKDVEIPYGDETWWTFDAYVRAKRSEIDVCFARITPDGDAPFISALALRPLPSTLTSTIVMNGTNRFLVCLGHSSYGVPQSGPSYISYPDDTLDRYWISHKAPDSSLNSTQKTINMSTDSIDQIPEKILQTTFTGFRSFISSWVGLEANAFHYVQFYFAEIEPLVNTTGMRVFNIFANGDLLSTEGSIDVFARVGANAVYSYRKPVTSNATGAIVFTFTSLANSTFPPFLAAAELFEFRQINALTPAPIVTTVEAIKTTLGLGRYTGDPCLPVGYGYDWLNCSSDNTGITAISLSNYQTNGSIPAELNDLTTLTEVRMNGNNLKGEIPDLSALQVLETLDLSNNNLSGSIPSYLSTLRNLKALYLQNNNLSGVIPSALLQRSQASLLTFKFSGNPSLCDSINITECSPSQSSLQAPQPLSSKSRSSTGIIVGISAAGVLLLGIAIGFIAYFIYKKKNSTLHNGTVHEGLSQVEVAESKSPVSPIVCKPIPAEQHVRRFSYREIEIATNNFTTRLGQGGFGPVYKGWLDDGRVAAIKVSSKVSNQGSKEFLNEIDLLSRLHHKSLVRLLGYSNEEKQVLVYEFMSEGSLFEHLHGPYFEHNSVLPWITRLRIILNAAEGLSYLHEGCSPQIIHRDIKSSNILLNAQMEAKISDFGISRNQLISGTGSLPTAVMGTPGYVDPEYIGSLKMTEQIDVYSFGVLLFEIVSGRPPIFESPPSKQTISITNWVKPLIPRGIIDDIVDPSLQGQYNVESVWKVVEVALMCVEMPSFKRPRISQVYRDLKEAMEIETSKSQDSY